MANGRIANLSDKLVLGALMLLAFAIPLAQTATTYAVNEPIKVMLLRIVTVLIAALWLIRIVESRDLTLKRTPLDLPLLSFLLVAGVATLFSVDRHLSLWGQLYRYEGLLTLFNYVFIYYATVNFIKGQRERNLLLGSILVVSGVVAVYAVLQHFGIDFITWDPEMMDVSRSIATFGNSVFLGAYLTLALPIAIIFAVYFPISQHPISDFEALEAPFDPAQGRQGSGLEVESQELDTKYQVPAFIPALLRIASVLLVSLLIAALVFSYTRAAWLGFLGASIFIGLMSLGGVRGRKKIAIPVIAILIMAVVAFGLAIPGGNARIERSLTSRLLSIFKVSEGSVSSRLVLWNTSLQMIKARPLLGFGPDTLALVFQRYQPENWYRVIKEEALPDKTHNDILQIAATMGLLGLLAYLWILIAFLSKGLSALRKMRSPHRHLLVGLMAAMIGYFIQIQFSFSIISVAPIFWLLLGLTMSTIEMGETKSVTVRVFRNGVPGLFRAVFYPGLAVLVVLLSISAIKPFLADQQVRKAWTSLAFNFWDEAASELEQAVKLNPGEARYSIRLGEAYLMKYRTTHEQSSREKALAALEVAKRIGPKHKNIYFYLGGLYVEMGKTSNPRYFDKAISNYKEVLTLNPNDVDAHFDLGIAYANRNKHDLAIKEWRRAIVLDPKFVAAYLVLGRAYELKKDWNAAEGMYRKVLEIDANNVYAKRALESLDRDTK